MKKVLFIFLGLLIATLPVSAEEGNKEEREIKIEQKEVEAYTDFDGFAELKQLDQGQYDIEISFVSYEKQQLSSFQLDKPTNKLLVKLKP